MTARIMVDLARLAYAKEPEFEHNEETGDETAIRGLVEAGKMEEVIRKPRPDPILQPQEAEMQKIKEKSNI